MGAGGAVLIIVVGAVLLFLVAVALILLVAAAVLRLSGKKSRSLAWSGVGVLAVPVLFIATLVVWGAAHPRPRHHRARPARADPASQPARGQ